MGGKPRLPTPTQEWLLLPALPALDRSPCCSGWEREPASFPTREALGQGQASLLRNVAKFAGEGGGVVRCKGGSASSDSLACTEDQAQWEVWLAAGGVGTCGRGAALTFPERCAMVHPPLLGQCLNSGGACWLSAPDKRFAGPAR